MIASADDITRAFAAGGPGHTISLPPGEWVIGDKPVRTSALWQTLRGCGDATVLRQSSVAADRGGIVNEFPGFRVERLRIESPTQTGNENIGVLSTGSDITVVNCSIVNFSYGVVSKDAVRTRVERNRIYSTGNGRDTGGAVQLSNAMDARIEDNSIDGDPDRRFQHGVYIAGDVDGLMILGNRIQSGFYSFAIHIYGATFSRGRRNLRIERNRIVDVPNGIIVSNAKGNDCDNQDIFIRDNSIHAEQRSLVLYGRRLEKVHFTGNDCASMFDELPIFEVGQVAGNSLDGLWITDNAFAGMSRKGLDFGGAKSISDVCVERNSLRPAAANGALFSFDNNSTAYRNIAIRNNVADGGKIGAWKQSPWLRMEGNSWQ